MNALAEPMISIGMPVYNGEKFLPKALRSLLAQDYRHFELIISDNHSTDGTPDICREFEATDSRIRYIRQPENRGSPWNFDFVLEQSVGDYFMWAAHDDLWRPTFIGKCVTMLASHPEAVLCCTEVNFIGEHDEPLPIYEGWKNIDTLGMNRVQRIHRLISVMGWYAIYGLLRPQVIRKIPLTSGRFGMDVVVTLQLLLQGHIVKVNESLFYSRIIKAKDAADYQADFNPQNSPRPHAPYPYTSLAVDLLEGVYESSLSKEEKTAAFADFLLTMSEESHDHFWRPVITQEILGSGARLDRAGFAFLLAKLFARSVPLSELRDNQILQAVYAPPAVAPDLVALAQRALAPQDFARATAAARRRDGAALFENGKVEEATRAFAGALKQEETADCWVDWATTQIVLGRGAEAEQGLRRALALQSDHPLAMLKLGILLAGTGRFQDALNFLNPCAETVPDGQRRGVDQLIQECRAKAAV